MEDDNIENNNNNNINQENEGSQEEIEENMEDNEDNKLMYIYEWVDSIPLSRQKKNISCDFNDAVLLAEMMLFSKKNFQIFNKIFNIKIFCKIYFYYIQNNVQLTK